MQTQNPHEFSVTTSIHAPKRTRGNYQHLRTNKTAYPKTKFGGGKHTDQAIIALVTRQPLQCHQSSAAELAKFPDIFQVPNESLRVVVVRTSI